MARTPTGIGLAMLWAAMVSLAPAHARPPKVGEPAPDFELTMLDRSKLSFSEMRGNVIVLNFWATWCAPCREELPLLDAFYDFQKQHGLKIIAISTETDISFPKLAKALSGLSMPAARRLKGPFEVIKEKGMYNVPSNYIIDRQGIVRYVKAGAFRLEDLNEILVPLLREPYPG